MTLMSLQAARDLLLTADLLRRAKIAQSTIDRNYSADCLRAMLEVVADLNDAGPDENWFRDYYLITGEHMQLTEEGWVPAEMNTREYTGEDPAEILDEVNTPPVASMEPK